MKLEDYNSMVRRKPSLLNQLGLEVEKPKKMKQVRESEIHKQIKGWCGRNDIDCTSGRMDKPTGRVPGEQDFTLYIPGGKPLLIEVKTANGKLSMDQERWHGKLWSKGYKVHVIRSYVEFLDLVREWEL